ncbi:MAG: hypothetical protein ABI151_03425 [Chitinophagaceae bacterium]
MKKSILKITTLSKIGIFVLSMVALLLLPALFSGCKKSAQNKDGVQPISAMISDNDVAYFYQAAISYSQHIGVTGQCEKYAVKFKKDRAGWKAAADADYLVKVKEVSVTDLATLGNRVSLRYGLDKKTEAERLTILREVFSQLDLTGRKFKAAAADFGDDGKCEEIRIEKQHRCDRDMALAVATFYTIGSIAVIWSAGLTAPAVYTGVMASVAFAQVRHSYCIDDSNKDYLFCAVP